MQSQANVTLERHDSSTMSTRNGDPEATAIETSARDSRSNRLPTESQLEFSGAASVNEDSESDTNLPSTGDAPDQKAKQNSALEPMPDGGFQAWIQVLCSWILFINTWGILV
jgi:hypothetical protein